ncbi:hypothetical protein XENTR_v10020548 [Xenopus tropicalis]|nr:hypothetical protein XENTR_v10020548 [Xenopus tropicalis]
MCVGRSEEEKVREACPVHFVSQKIHIMRVISPVRRLSAQVALHSPTVPWGAGFWRDRAAFPGTALGYT